MMKLVHDFCYLKLINNINFQHFVFVQRRCMISIFAELHYLQYSIL